MKALAGTVYWVSTEFLLLSSPAVRLAAAVAGVVNGTKCCHAVFVFGTNDEYSAVGRKTHLLSALRQFFWGPYRVFFCYRVSVVRDCLVNLAPPTSAANLDDANENKLRRKSLHGLKRRSLSRSLVIFCRNSTRFEWIPEGLHLVLDRFFRIDSELELVSSGFTGFFYWDYYGFLLLLLAPQKN